MANFSVHVATEQFERVTLVPPFMPSFNEAKYGRLVDALLDRPCLRDPHLEVHLEPWWPLLAHTKTAAIFRTLQRQGRTQGHHQEEGIVRVAVRPDAAGSNSTLLHETRHWADHVLGLTPTHEEMRRIRLKRLAPYAGGIVACSTAGTVALTVALEPAFYAPIVGVAANLAAVRVAAPMVMHRPGYEALSWERDAREFAANPTVQASYGDIITVHSLAS